MVIYRLGCSTSLFGNVGAAWRKTAKELTHTITERCAGNENVSDVLYSTVCIACYVMIDLSVCLSVTLRDCI